MPCLILIQRNLWQSSLEIVETKITFLDDTVILNFAYGQALIS